MALCCCSWAIQRMGLLSDALTRNAGPAYPVEQYNSAEHFERSKKFSNRDEVNEGTIRFKNDVDFMRNRVHGPLACINVTIVREFYSNFSSLQQDCVTLRRKHIPITKEAHHEFLRVIARDNMTWESYSTRENRINNKILKPEAATWHKLIVCNIQPVSHHTTFNMDHAMLTFTLMTGGVVNLAKIMREYMYIASGGAIDQRFPYLVMIPKLATTNEVQAFPEDEFLDIEGR
ncbi:hypothetical protein PIB30_013530 [Stylosanthes scabra]|uniref:Putative plant transposon protein domain-containing protein n=1 Tax=Stylosanthes scabra TaxID=79078 RepID=A0ABU6R6L1_9FABA|nr:hypothetical protein [Stylosanthes scabra]